MGVVASRAACVGRSRARFGLVGTPAALGDESLVDRGEQLVAYGVQLLARRMRGVDGAEDLRGRDALRYSGGGHQHAG